MAEDLGAQLKLQQEINKALRERAGYLRQQSQMLSQQSVLSQQMCDALGGCDFGKIVTDAENLKDELGEVASKAEDSADSLKGLEEAAEDAGDAFEGMTKKGLLIGAVAGGLRGFMGSLKMSFGITKGFGKILKNVIGSVLDLGMSIVALPFKMLTGLIKMSQKGGIDPLRVALEEVKDVMGDIASNEGKMLADTVGNLRSQMRDMAGTGLSMGRVFGYGREGLAKFLKENLELSEKVGIGFGNLRGEFAKNAVSLAMYRKGLGITNEQQAIMIRMAKARGESMIEEQTAFASMAIQMGKQFDVSKKVVGKAMAQMAADVSNFGSMGRKHLGATAVYAAKLGIEIKALSGLFDKFNNFENAAKGAAEMSQAFGMNVDAMELLKASSPAEIADTIRKSFHEAGNSLEDMDRHQRAMLEAQTGFKGADLEAFLSPENMDMDYDDILAGADEAENKQLTQLETMKALTKDIKKEIKSGAHQWESFGQAFSEGFTTGLQRSAEFKRLMINIQVALRKVNIAGRQVGQAFVKYFPGVKDIFKGLADFFDPVRFQKLADGLVRVFTGFFKDLDKNPKKAAQNFIDNILQLFTDTFSDSGSSLKRVATGFEKFFTAISHIIAGLIPIVLKAMTKAFKTIFEFIVNPTAFMKKLQSAGAAGKSFAGRIFKPILDAFSDPATAKLFDQAWLSFKHMMSAAWDRIKGPLETLLGYYFAILIGKAILFGVVSAAAGMLTGAVMTKGVPALAKGFAGAMSSVFKGANGARLTKAAVDGGRLWGSANSLKIMSSAGKQIYGASAQAALKKGSAKAIGTGFKGGLKAAAVNIQGSTSRVVGKALSSGPVMASVAKGAGHMAKGLAIAGKAAFKAIPVIGWAATIGFALYEGVTHGMKVYERTGGDIEKGFNALGGGIISSLTFGLVSPESSTKIFTAFNFMGTGLMRGIDRLQNGGSWKDAAVAFGGGVLEAITFGLVDGDALEDFVGTSNRYGEKLAREMVQATQGAYDKGIKEMQPLVDAAKTQMQSFLDTYADQADDLERLRQEMGKNLTGAGKAAVDAMLGMEKEQAKIAEKYEKQNEKLQKMGAQASRIPDAFEKSLKAAKGTFADSDMTMAFNKEQMDSGMAKAMAKKLQAKFGKDAIKFSNNMITIDDDVYQKHMGSLRKIITESGSQDRFKKDIQENTSKAQREFQNTLMKVPLESMIEARRQAALAGVEGPAMQALHKKLRDRTELEEMKKALAKAGVTDFKGKTIKGAFMVHLKKLQRKDMAKAREFRVGFDIARDKALKEVNDAAMTAAEKNDSKLAGLLAADEVVKKIEQIKDIPARLKVLQKELKGIDEAEVKTSITLLFKKLGKISDIMVTESKTFGDSSGSIAIALGGVTDGLGNLDIIFQRLDAVMSLDHLSDPKKAEAIVKSIQTMKGLLKPAVASVGAVQPFSGGHLEVTHNLPNTNIIVDVHLDAKKLGKTVGRVNIGKDNASGKAYMSVLPLPTPSSFLGSV